MNLLLIGTVLCLCLELVNPDVDIEFLRGSRSGGKHKRRSKGHMRRRNRSGTKPQTGVIPYLSSYNVSTSVKGVTCNNGVCHHYGPSNSIPASGLGDPKWILKVNKIQYFCFNENVQLCPQFKGGTYERYKGHKRAPKGVRKDFEMVVCGKLYLCRAPNKDLCPKVPIVQSDWKEVTKEKAYILRTDNLIIVCVASDIDKCYEKYGRDKWVIANDVLNIKGVSWFAVIDGVKYYCKGTKLEDCPTIEGSNPTDWKRYCTGTDTEECKKDSQWEQNVDGVIIICMAHDIDDCKRIYSGDWVPSERGKNGKGKPKGAPWVSEGGGADIYCTAGSSEKCPTLEKGGRTWEKVPENEPEDKSGAWQQKVKGVTIICVADDIEDCKKIREGQWKPSDRNRDGNGVPEDTIWVIDVDDVKVYCDAKATKSCPKLKKGGRKWKGVSVNEPDDPDDTDDPENKKGGREWQQRVKGVTIICIAYDVKDCKEVFNGHWKPSDRDRDENGVPEDTSWVIHVGKVKVYCEAKAAKSCPKLKKGGRKWKGVSVNEPENPDDPDEPKNKKGGREWQQRVNGVTIICIAHDIKDCKEVFNGHWKPSDRERDENGVPEDTSWVIHVGKVKVYCEAKAAKSCPKLKKGGRKWKGVSVNEPENPDYPDEPKNKKGGREWQQKVKGVTIICIADDVRDCNKVRNGRWNPSDRKKDDNGNPKDVKWVIEMSEVTAYCDAKISKKCPEVKGGRQWGPLNGEQSRRRTPGDLQEVDVAVITPEMTGGNRFRQPQGDDTVILCYGENSDNCPDGRKWIKTKKEEVGEKVDSIITVRNVWVKKIKNRHVVCVAADLKDCQPGDEGWVIIGGMKAGLWQTHSSKLHIYCEAAEKSNCPEDVGNWELVSMDQWSQKTLDWRKKGEMWRLVTFTSTLYCGAKYAGKCPKIKGYKWHKVFSIGIDFSSYGKEVHFEKEIGKTYYGCTAKKKEACPELPSDGKWKEIKEKVTLDVILKYFEDVVGFEDACKSAICRLKKGEDVFNDDVFGRKKKHTRTKEKHRKRNRRAEKHRHHK